MEEISKSLRKIQIALKAPKGRQNEYTHFNYRNCDDIFKAVKPLLEENECTLKVTDELVLIGTRYYVKARAEIFDDAGNSISTEAYAREEESKKGMDSSQITGSASSYARKYALNGLFCIDDTKDADTYTSNTNEPQEDVKKASENQIKLIKSLVDDIPKMLKWAGADKIEDMSMEKASECIAKMTKKKEGK